MTIPTLATKKTIRDQIAKDTKAFLENGGQIYQAQIGECKEKPASEFKAKIYENSNF